MVAVRPGLLHAWVLLTKCFTKLQLFDDALVSAAKADKLLNSINNSNVLLRSVLDKVRLEVLCRSDDIDKLNEAVRIGENVSMHVCMIDFKNGADFNWVEIFNFCCTFWLPDIIVLLFNMCLNES